MSLLLPLHRNQTASNEHDDSDIEYRLWDEEDEILYVLEKDKETDRQADEPIMTRSSTTASLQSKLRFPHWQNRRARHVPGPLFMPVLFVEWALHPVHVLLDSIDEYIKRDDS